MAIKCSLLGHRYTETDVEEEREEQGSEVVITVRDVETCERCGHRRVVSENKEVTSLAAGEGEAEPGDVDGGSAGAADAVGGTDAVGPDIDAAEDDAELIGEAEPDAGGDETIESAESTATTADEGEGEPAAADSAADDDGAVILDDGEERDPGEWPDDAEGEEAVSDVSQGDEAATDDDAGTDDPVARAREATAEEWPDEYGHEEGSDATADEVDWPEEEGDAGDEWTPTESLTENIDAAEVEPAGTAGVVTPEGEFVCPECDFATPVEESSLRAGDFCPDCRRGALEHREAETRKE